MQSLPPETARLLFDWALRQPQPFRASQAAAAAGATGPGALAQVPAALAVHPSIAAWDGWYYTPRIMAGRTTFLIRPRTGEIAAGVLVEGHRLLPFRRFEARPGEATLVAAGGVRVASSAVTVAREDAEACYTLLGQAAYPGATSGPLASVPGWKLPSSVWPLQNPPDQLRARCLNFDRGEYVVERAYEHGDSIRLNAALVEALEEILDDPPPGPRFAARQMLQALARCFDLLGDLPVGPLGPLFTEIDLVDVKGRAVYVVDERKVDGSDFEDVPAAPTGPEAVRPDANDPAAKLLAALEAAVAGSRRRPTGLRVSSLGWDEERARIVAKLGEERWFSIDVALSLEPPCVPLRPKCACNPIGQICDHAVALFEFLARDLHQATSDFSRQLRNWLALAPWQVHLKRLDRVLAAAARPETVTAPVEERVVWRFSVMEGGFGLAPCVQRRSGKGAWSTGKVADAEELLRKKRALLTEQDVSVARAFGSQGKSYGWSARHGCQLSREDLVETALRLVGHPQVLMDGERDPIRVERAPLKLEVRAGSDGGFKLVASAGDLPFLSCDRVAVGTQGFVLRDPAGRRILIVECLPRARDLAAEIHRGGGEFPKEAAVELESRLAAIEAVAPVDLPPELAGETVAPDARTILRLSPLDSGGLTASMRIRPLPGAPAVFPPGEGPVRIGGVVEGKRRSAMRDLPAETARASSHAETLGLRALPESAPWTWTIESDEEALGLVERLQAGAPEDLVVEWPDESRRLRLSTASVPDLRVKIEEKNDWFGLDGHVEVDGSKVSLGALMAALRENRRFVPVSSGRWMSITREFRERLRELSDLSLPGKSGLELSPIAAPFVAELVREAGLVKACEAWKKLHKRFDAAARLDPDPPTAFAATFRDYQLDGYRWMSRLAAWGAGACLADDMGLGKTVQALALLMDRAAEGPALVVAPTSVASNWLAETARFAPTLRPVLYRETDRLAKPDTFKPGDLVVASYGLVLRDAARLEQVPWGTLILDEAQFVKNSRTQTAASIRRIPAKWRLALTGTPVENHLGDLWSLFRAVSPGLFGSWDSFRDRFAAPIERDKDAGRRQALARMVRPFILRRSKAEVLQELPARTEIVLRAELSPEERALYDQSRLRAAMSFGDTRTKRGPEERIQVLAAITRLRQFACHPRLVLPEAPPSSAKLRLFLRTVEELREGRHRALVFSQFTSFLALAREALDAAGVRYRYLDGATPPRQRDTEIAAFQRGEGDLFLISLKAGGTGLNLTAADYVLHLDPWWNPAVEDQATDRAHRIGQTRPVTVYRLVASDTIEEKILALHGTKRELVASILDGTDHAARLSTEELIALIREGSSAGKDAELVAARGQS